jgi:hypothetical protein
LFQKSNPLQPHQTATQPLMFRPKDYKQKSETEPMVSQSLNKFTTLTKNMAAVLPKG